MKIYSQVACLVSILVVLLAGCSPAASTPPADTPAVPPATTAAPLLSATQPLPTVPAPTQTPLPPSPTLPLPVDTPLSTALPTVAPATPVSSPVPPAGDLPMAGMWTGGGTDLLVSFYIQSGGAEATLSNVGILWDGGYRFYEVDTGDDEPEKVYYLCEVNTQLDVLVPLDENGFELEYHGDEFSVIMRGTHVSSTVIDGVLILKVDRCGNHQVSWRAVPKMGASQ